MPLATIETGLVYRNPEPHLRAIHAWHPSLVRRKSGELLATFDLGQGVESLDYRTYLVRSTDDGRTWTEPAPVIADSWAPTPNSKTPPRLSTHSVRLGGLSDGTLILFGGRFYRDNPREGLTNRENLGYVPMDLIQLTSQDGGQRWQGPVTVNPPLVGPSFETCHRVIELADGRLLAPTSTWKSWQGDAPNGMKAVALVSRDRGATWPEYLDVMDGYSRGVIHFEQSIAQLTDGRLLVVAWAFHEPTGRSLPTPFALSEDGQTFSAPRENGMRAQTAKIITLQDGRVLCLYRRDDRPGLWAELAEIRGETWIRLEEARLWNGAPSGVTGEGTAADEISGLKFGYPSLVETRPGQVLALFWANEDCIHNVRWLRLSCT